ncbi:MAG: hypothetical protein LBK29_02130, partial [Oscillospiraceae bacterium]|nr:hypothetical protein [Oscillospiraceae bacterium]
MEDIRINKNLNLLSIRVHSCSILFNLNLNFYNIILKRNLKTDQLHEIKSYENSLVYFFSPKTDKNALQSILDLLSQLRASENAQNVTIQNNTIIKRQILDQLKNEIARSENDLEVKKFKELEVIHSDNFSEKKLTKIINQFLRLKKKVEINEKTDDSIAGKIFKDYINTVISSQKNIIKKVSHKKLFEESVFKSNVLENLVSKRNTIKEKKLNKDIVTKNEDNLEFIFEKYIKLNKSLINHIEKKYKTVVDLEEKKEEISKKIKYEVKKEFEKFKNYNENKIQTKEREIKKEKENKIFKKDDKTVKEKNGKISYETKKTNQEKSDYISAGPKTLQETALELRRINDKIIENKIKKLRVNTIVNINALTKRDLLSKNIYSKINNRIDSNLFKSTISNSFSKISTKAVLVNRNFKNLVTNEDYESFLQNVVINKVKETKKQKQNFLFLKKIKIELLKSKTKQKDFNLIQRHETAKKKELNIFEKNKILKSFTEKEYFSK